MKLDRRFPRILSALTLVATLCAPFVFAQSASAGVDSILFSFQATDVASNLGAPIEGADPSSVAPGDIDGDGDQDLAVALFNDSEIVWYENGGDGSAWTSHIVIAGNTPQPLAMFPTSVAVGDIDEDGDLDIASSAGDTIRWHENTAGDGSAWSVTNVVTDANSATHVTIADLDNDGDMDLLSTSQNDNAIARHINTAGDGSTWNSLELFTSASQAQSVEAGDLDGDGDQDLVAAAFGTDTIWFFRSTTGDGIGWAGAPIGGGDGVKSIAVGDLDGDGDLDLASASENAGTIAWHENDSGDASDWTATNIDTTADRPDAVTVQDMDADGDLDLVSSNLGDDEIAWYENTAGNASSWTERDIATSADDPTMVAVADLDGDGDSDVASTSSDDDTVAWYQSLLPIRSRPSWKPKITVEAADQTTPAVASGDIDGDGDVDLASAQTIADKIVWHQNTAGTGASWTSSVIVAGTTPGPDSPQDLALADLDSDGDLDALAVSAADDTVAWYENNAGNGSSWTEGVISTTVMDSRSVLAADLDKDGDLDVAATDLQSDKITWFKNNGDGSAWTPADVTTTANSPAGLTSADVDSDGDMDLIAAVWFEQTVAWYDNTNGDGSSWVERDISVGVLDPWALVAGDIDGDGDIDVATTSFGVNRVVWYENTNGLGTLWSSTDVANLVDPRSIDAGDLDSDGDLDLAVANSAGTELTWIENAGAGWVDIGVDFSSPFSDVEIADINGDAELDLASTTSTGANSVFWYEAIPTVNVQETSASEGEIMNVVVAAGRNYEQITAKLTTPGGPTSATAGEDYTQVIGADIVIPVGAVLDEQPIETIEDSLDEPDEILGVQIDDPTNAGLGFYFAELTITDDDPKPGLTINDKTVTEKSGNLNVQLTLTLSTVSGRDVQIAIDTADSSAKNGKDYVRKSTTVTIPAGTLTKKVSFTVKDDTIDEKKEKFFVDIASDEATSNDRATIKIKDNDPKPSLSVSDVSKKEKDSGKTTYEFKVKLSKESGKVVSVDWKTVKNSALSPSDFVAKSGKLKFSPGTETKTVKVKVKSDDLDEAKEKFFVKLSGAKNASIADKKGNGVIKDDD